MDLVALWLPIVLSAAAIWIVSTIFGMPFLHHKNDFVGLPGAQEDALMESIRTIGIEPGNYLFPDFRTREAMQSERVDGALKEGPVGHLSLWRAPLTMGDKLAGTLVVHVAVSALIAYQASVALPQGAGFARVFRVVATAGILAYAFASIPNALWFGAYKRTIAATIFDGLVYGCIIGAIFAWCWPR